MLSSGEISKLLSDIPKSVTVVAVSKLQNMDQIRKLHHEHGLFDFGENYIQEASAKIAQLADLQLRWHFIGRLQKNKIKAVVGQFDLIHSVDSLGLAQAINRHAEEKKIIQKVLLQVNIAQEDSKGGFGVSDLERVFLELKDLECVSLAGLMTMPPLDRDNRPHFASLRKLRDRFQSENPDCRFLSMGTSSDYQTAIQEGATHVRLGTVLFGQRPSK